jgi:hypothetical protein
MGAAWANAIAYGTLAVVTVWFSMRLYPIRYEWSRLMRIVIGGATAYAAATWAVARTRQPFYGLVLHAGATLVTYGLVLAASGFFHAGEWRMLTDIRRRAFQRKGVPRVTEPEGTQVEMAGEIVATAPEPVAEPLESAPSTEGRTGR